MISNIHFCARLDAETRLRHADPRKVAVVSITDPGQLTPLHNWTGNIFRVAFLDVVPNSDTVMPMPPHALTAETADLLVQYLEYLDRHRAVFELVVHCEFGASRSAAVALYAEALTGAELHRRYLAFGGNRHVLDVLQQVRPVHPPVSLPEAHTYD